MWRIYFTFDAGTCIVFQCNLDSLKFDDAAISADLDVLEAVKNLSDGLNVGSFNYDFVLLYFSYQYDFVIPAQC